MPYEYSKLLEDAFKKMPHQSESADRFVMPKAQVQPDGARTIIVNFREITETLRREPDHLIKFILKELATKGEVQEGRLIVQGRFRQDMIDRKLEIYAKEYVFCNECGKPDTKIIKEDRYSFLKCEACGAKQPVKKV
jgi:translation initiation factor 2 subunit 2